MAPSKFNSLGTAEEQATTLGRVKSLLAALGTQGYNLLTPSNQIFIDDCRLKLAQPGARMFGWKQVERLERLATAAEALILAQAVPVPGGQPSPLGPAAVAVVEAARLHALEIHGPLKSGPDRWERLLTEEYREVLDELATINVLPRNEEAKGRAILELGQLAQLCIGCIELIQQGRVK